MTHNITVEGGTSVRLPTAGKYCDRDIVVTATGGGAELPALDDPAAAEEVFLGKEYIDETGAKKTGTFTAEEEVDNLKSLTEELLTALEGKASASVETCAVTITEQEGTVDGSLAMVAYCAYENGSVATKYKYTPLEYTGVDSILSATLENVVKGTAIVFFVFTEVLLSGNQIEVGEYDTDAANDGYFVIPVTVFSDADITVEGV